MIYDKCIQNSQKLFSKNILMPKLHRKLDKFRKLTW